MPTHSRLIRNNTSKCNTPQKPTLSRQESQHLPQTPLDLGIARTASVSSHGALPAGGEVNSFGDSYDITTLLDKSQRVADSSLALNKSMRRLFPASDTLNQSSDFDSSSLLTTRSQHESEDKHATYGMTQNRKQQNVEQQQRCFKNNLFTSTPIRNGNMAERNSPAPTPLNHTFPLRQPTMASSQQHNPQQQSPLSGGGHRKQANRTISLGEFMGRTERDEFPALGHNNNYANNHRRKAHSSANVSGLSAKDRALQGAAKKEASASERPNCQQPQKHKPKRRVVPISLSTTTTQKTCQGKDPLTHFESSSIPGTTPFALSPSMGSGILQSSLFGHNTEEHGFGSEFINSPFRNTNNLLSVQGIEQCEKPARDLLHERRLLKEDKEAIRSDFHAEAMSREQTPGNLRSAVMHLLSSTKGKDVTVVEGQESVPAKDGQWDLRAGMQELKHRDKLDICATIYSLILNLNMTTNVLSELTFLLTLINMDVGAVTAKVRQLSIGEAIASEVIVEPQQVEIEGSSGLAINTATVVEFGSLFKTPLNCVYLAVEVLFKQRGKLLALLDAKTLRILIENEKLGVLSGGLITYLQDVYRIKGELELRYCTEYDGFKAGGGQNSRPTQLQAGDLDAGQQSVFYQVENDTRDNFPTQAEFVAFKKQRDLFYVILRMWEERHLHAGWNFGQELGGRIRYLFAVMPHPINMAHLAKLFTSQLIVCCQNWNNVEQSAAQAELLQRFDNVDLSKLSKLEQRLVQPGISSAELQFPGIQVFFKEFIVVAESSPAFVEQLKIALMAELVARNDSTFEVLNVTTKGCRPIKDNEFNEIVVRICFN